MSLDIKDYLKKFETLLPFETKVKNVVIQSTQEVLGYALDRKKIRVQGAQVFIQGPAALKSEIAMKQVKILARIKELQPTITIQRIS